MIERTCLHIININGVQDKIEKDRKVERKEDRKTERQKDRKTERQRDRPIMIYSK